MLKILGRANSLNVRKVLWLCGELGIEFERTDWGRGFRPTADPEFLAVNPLGLVPAVVDGEVILRESNTILRYLAARYGPDEIYPANLQQRAHVEQWMDWVAYETSISLRGAFLGGQLNEEPWNNPWFIEQGRRQISIEIGQLDQHLRSNGPYVTGDVFTIGDIPVGLVVNRWFHLEFERPSYPAVEDYYALLDEREAFRTFVHNGMP